MRVLKANFFCFLILFCLRYLWDTLLQSSEAVLRQAKNRQLYHSEVLFFREESFFSKQQTRRCLLHLSVAFFISLFTFLTLTFIKNSFHVSPDHVNVQRRLTLHFATSLQSSLFSLHHPHPQKWHYSHLEFFENLIISIASRMKLLKLPITFEVSLIPIKNGFSKGLLLRSVSLSGRSL